MPNAYPRPASHAELILIFLRFSPPSVRNLNNFFFGHGSAVTISFSLLWLSACVSSIFPSFSSLLSDLHDDQTCEFGGCSWPFSLPSDRDVFDSFFYIQFPTPFRRIHQKRFIFPLTPPSVALAISFGTDFPRSPPTHDWSPQTTGCPIYSAKTRAIRMAAPLVSVGNPARLSILFT